MNNKGKTLTAARRTFLLAAAVFAVLQTSACGTPEKLPEQAEASSGGNAETEVSGETSAGEDDGQTETAVLTFSEEQSHTGDLILVSKEWPYDFEANAGLQLVRILDAQTYSYPVSKEEFTLAAEIMPDLDAMIRACDEAMGTEYTSVSSAYRSKEYQENVRAEYKELYGEEYVQKYVAEPGKSEHHTGLALDMGIIYEDGSEGTFSESDNAAWMAENAYRYGFVRRYAEDKTEITGISNEAWHFRYVGRPHAAYMHKYNLCLEEYLDFLAKETWPEAPLAISEGGRNWKVFHTSLKTIPEPEGNYTVSGDNKGGCIVTVEEPAS